MDWSPWKKVDHFTFLIALVLAIANIWLMDSTVNIAVVILLLIALVYDMAEHRH